MTHLILTLAGVALIVPGLVQARRKGAVLSSLLPMEGAMALFATADFLRGGRDIVLALVPVIFMIAVLVAWLRLRPGKDDASAGKRSNRPRGGKGKGNGS